MPHPTTDSQQRQRPVEWLLTGRLERDGRRCTRSSSGAGLRRRSPTWPALTRSLCVLEDALLPAERAMVEMGEQQRVREARTFLQVATAGQFIATVEAITGRTVRAFACATDPDQGVVMENFIFAPEARPESPTLG